MFQLLGGRKREYLLVLGRKGGDGTGLGGGSGEQFAVGPSLMNSLAFYRTFICCDTAREARKKPRVQD